MPTVTLGTGRTITITPPAGRARIDAQFAFAKRFKALVTEQPTDPEAQRKVMVRLAWSLARYTTLTPAELVDVFMQYPYDASAVARAALG